MIDIDQKILPLRTPAFTQEALMIFDLSGSHEHWLVLCGVSDVGVVEADFLDSHRDDFGRECARLLALCPNAPTFHTPWIRQTPYLRLPILADPLLGQHRLFNMVPKPLAGQCCSALIDPSGRLRFRLIHDLSGVGA